MASALAATPAATEALGTWLPNVAPNFSPWGNQKTTYGVAFDAFRCPGTAPAVTTKAQDFDFPIGTCRALQTGTTLFYGSGEPQQGKVLYDAANHIALYYVGCCAARTYVLASGVVPPPSSVVDADLSAVKTSRGITLGASTDDVIRVYGKAIPYTVGSGASTVPLVSYATFKADPVHSDGGCGQYVSFAFKQKKVNLIQIYAGC